MKMFLVYHTSFIIKAQLKVHNMSQSGYTYHSDPKLNFYNRLITRAISSYISVRKGYQGSNRVG